MAVKVFLAYTFKDEAARNELINHLYQLRWQGLIADWEERATGQGLSWQGSGEISSALERAQLILLLVSPDFVHSAYCYSAELKVALQRHNAGLARVIPVLVRPTEREDTPLADLAVLPTNGVAISAWEDREAAWQQVIAELGTWLAAAASASATSTAAIPLPPPPTPPVEPATAASSSSSPSLWLVPYRRNPLFTGRSSLLAYLHDMPISNKASAVTPAQVVSGPAGSGKTQLALEYAYRYGHEYEAVLWVNAASRQLLIHELARIAEALELPERVLPNQYLVALAVRRWLEKRPGWLLILDNVADGETIRDLLPVGARGHQILLARQPLALPKAMQVTLPALTAEEAALLLLRAAGSLPVEATLEQAPPAEASRADEVVAVLRAYPLALALAGAYIETEQCSLSSYLNLYKQASVELQRSIWSATHQVDSLFAPLATVLHISLSRAERISPSAAELLRLCSFLQPDHLPLELLVSGGSELGESLGQLLLEHFDLLRLIHELRRFALVDYSRGSLVLHRLVSAFVRQRLSRESRLLWAEQTIRLVESACQSETATPTALCRAYLPHLLTCARWVEEWQLVSPDAARLLEQTGYYLQRCVAYREAEPLLRRALLIREQQLGPEHPELSASLYNLGLFYEEQGRSPEAEALYWRVVAIEERQAGNDHQGLTRALYRLALLYRDRRDFERAESLFLQVLESWRQELAPEHPLLATLYHELATLYRVQERYEQAEWLYQQALRMRRHLLGSEHLAVAQTLSALGSLYHAQRHHEQAEQCYLQALTIQEGLPLAEQLDLATTLNNLALLYRETGRYGQAELLYQRALVIYRQLVGDEHPYTASCLENLAMLYHDRGEYERAEPLYQSALQIRERMLGADHPALAINLNNLATLYTALHKYGPARALFKRALEIGERVFGKNHPTYARFLENYALLLQQTRQVSRALELRARAREIQARQAQSLSIGQAGTGAAPGRAVVSN
ncbi:tetratricopeptide repeat protein [Thermogemmatispora aurantia]|jgi:tetratricopeptide (TPR) repeat protein|uniref:Tetratricopeptide repeat protein n=1 Tax=Thermogemmatispora aurantia TaxID=2045279 RepID=A0A5J4JWN9_9CHLR|nr:FxSxx-COOH system tetratricopeptide repeat protein [Thermogemmatispora aurantia]GER81898.1 tetratricopeptide repeat protein [Thermogemmatispora aurantia]